MFKSSSLFILLLLLISEFPVFDFFQLTKIILTRRLTRLYQESTPEWWLQTDDLVINREINISEKSQENSNHLFDAIYKSESRNSVESQDNGVISSLSVSKQNNFYLIDSPRIIFMYYYYSSAIYLKRMDFPCIISETSSAKWAAQHRWMWIAVLGIY